MLAPIRRRYAPVRQNGIRYQPGNTIPAEMLSHPRSPMEGGEQTPIPPQVQARILTYTLRNYTVDFKGLIRTKRMTGYRVVW
jgi:hypothetical protein